MVSRQSPDYAKRLLPVLPDGVNQITNYLLPILETLANAVTAHSPLLIPQRKPPGLAKQLIR